MVLHIQHFIDKRIVKAKETTDHYTDAHLYIEINEFKYFRSWTHANSMLGHPIAFKVIFTANQPKWYDCHDIQLINKINAFFEEEIFFYFRGEVLIRADVFPEIISSLPNDFPKEYKTNPTRKVKILNLVPKEVLIKMEL